MQVFKFIWMILGVVAGCSWIYQAVMWALFAHVPPVFSGVLAIAYAGLTIILRVTGQIKTVDEDAS